MIDTH